MKWKEPGSFVPPTIRFGKMRELGPISILATFFVRLVWFGLRALLEGRWGGCAFAALAGRAGRQGRLAVVAVSGGHGGCRRWNSHSTAVATGGIGGRRRRRRLHVLLETLVLVVGAELVLDHDGRFGHLLQVDVLKRRRNRKRFGNSFAIEEKKTKKNNKFKKEKRTKKVERLKLNFPRTLLDCEWTIFRIFGLITILCKWDLPSKLIFLSK